LEKFWNKALKQLMAGSPSPDFSLLEVMLVNFY